MADKIEKKAKEKLSFEHWLWLLLSGILGVDVLNQEGPIFGTYIGDIIVLCFFGCLWYYARKHDHVHDKDMNAGVMIAQAMKVLFSIKDKLPEEVKEQIKESLDNAALDMSRDKDGKFKW